MANKYAELFSGDMTQLEANTVYFSKYDEALQDGTLEQLKEALRSVAPAIISHELEAVREGWLG